MSPGSVPDPGSAPDPCQIRYEIVALGVLVPAQAMSTPRIYSPRGLGVVLSTSLAGGVRSDTKMLTQHTKISGLYVCIGCSLLDETL